MKKFLIKISLFSLVLLTLIFWVFLQADGKTDPFYLRFTTPRQENLILGTSKSAQGLKPIVLDSVLEKKFFNYSFTLSHSPYGPIYLESIKRKLNTNTKNGVFIVTVDPWSVSSTSKNPNDVSSFRENKLILSNVRFVNYGPNIEYLFNNLDGNFYSTLLDVSNNSMTLHKDGWLEIFASMDSVDIEERKSRFRDDYEEYLSLYKPSPLRIGYLKETIEYLKKYGKVYLVRMPVDQNILDIENQLMPDFDSQISSAIEVSDGYLDLTLENHSFEYVDGVHVYKNSTRDVSMVVAEWIKEKLD